MKKLIIIKLGGSVVTYKDSNKPRARIDVIRRLSKEFKSLFDQQKYQLLLVHGAGSFAHPPAKKYALSSGMKTNLQKFGFGFTQQRMIELNSIIVKELLRQQLPVFSIPPRAFVQTENRKTKQFDLAIIQQALAKNLIPVLFGDPVLDITQGSAILSGDAIISYLAKSLAAEKIIFLSDVDGIFDQDPKKNPGAKLIPEINNQNLEKVLVGITINNPYDVTGEMKGKILEIKQELPKQHVKIANGLKDNQLNLILQGQSVGTKLFFG